MKSRLRFLYREKPSPVFCRQTTDRWQSGALFVDDYRSVSDIRPQGMGGNNQDRNDGALAFDASRCSSIYGNSDTVQPPAMTVRYYIKAA